MIADTSLVPFLMVFAGLALFTLGIRTAPPDVQLAHRQRSRPMTIATLVALGIAYAVGRSNPAHGWYVIASWPALSLPFAAVGMRRAGLVGKSFNLMFAGQVLAATGIVIVAFAAAQRAP